MYTIFPYTPVFRTAVVAQNLVRQRDELVLDGGERVGIGGAARLVEQRLQFGERRPGVLHGDVRRRCQAPLVQQVGEGRLLHRDLVRVRAGRIDIGGVVLQLRAQALQLADPDRTSTRLNS